MLQAIAFSHQETSHVTRFVTHFGNAERSMVHGEGDSATRSAPQPQVGELPALRPAAAAALDVEPRELVERWLAALSPTARRSYRRSLVRFAAWAMADDERPESALRLLCSLDIGRAGELVRRWRDELLASGLASGSVAGYVTGLVSLVSACRRAGLVTWRLEAVQPRVEQRHDRSGPRRGDVERLLATIDDAAERGSAQAVRDAALVRLLYGAALRRSEAAGLRLDDVDLQADGGPLVKPRRKGHKERKAVSIGEHAAAAMARWLALRGVEPGPVFVRVKGRTAESGALNGETVRRIVAKWAKRAGLRGAVRPHGMRHSAATEVARRGSLAQLMALGGWASLTAARRYLDEHREERAAALRLVDV